MVGNELKVQRQSSIPEYVPPEQYKMMKKYSKDWKIREILEVLQKDIEFMNSGECYSFENAEKAWDSDAVRRTLSKISSELLSRSPSEKLHIVNEIKELEQAYKNVMEKFLRKMEQFLHSIRELREELRKSVKQFHNIARVTTRITLVSSVTDVALLTVNALHKVFHFERNPRVFFVATVVEITSIAASLFALSYMKQSTTEISNEVRDENRLFRDLVTAHRKGNWIDQEMLRFFPTGIDLDFFSKKGMETFEDRASWRTYLCSVIILTNVQKNSKLLKDEAFLARVKVFVESQAAEIWWHRMKMKKLLKAMMEKMDSISSKEFVEDHKVHYNRTAFQVYPILIPWLLNAWNSTRMRLFFSSIAAILAFSDLANNETEEFEKLKKISQKFGKDFEEITQICNTLDNDYD